jgi:hypothetical protein
MSDDNFTPVTITKAIAAALPVRYGYTTLIYRLSTPVSRAWIARFEAACRTSAGSWRYDRPIALADRIQVMLPDSDHADHAALAAIKEYLEAALAVANQRYSNLPPEVLASGAREIAWEQRVLTALQTTLDEQFPG